MQGPRIYMSSSEYAFLRRRTQHMGKSINQYCLDRALNADLGPDPAWGLRDRLNRIGHDLNHLVWGIHRGNEVNPAEIKRMLQRVSQVLDELPAGRGHRLTGDVDRAGSRAHRGWVRGSLDEIEQIQERAQKTGLSRPAFIRAAVLGGPLGLVVWDDVIREVCYIANNIKQLGATTPASGLGEVLQELQIIHRIRSFVREFSAGRLKRTP